MGRALLVSLLLVATASLASAGNRGVSLHLGDSVQTAARPAGPVDNTVYDVDGQDGDDDQDLLLITSLPGYRTTGDTRRGFWSSGSVGLTGVENGSRGNDEPDR